MENIVSWLPLLACPVGMGLMMWLMMRGQPSRPAGSARVPSVNAEPADPLTSLRDRLGQIQVQQAAISAEIARLSADEGPAEGVPDAQPDPVEPRPPAIQTAHRTASGPSPE